MNPFRAVMSGNPGGDSDDAELMNTLSSRFFTNTGTLQYLRQGRC